MRVGFATAFVLLLATTPNVARAACAQQTLTVSLSAGNLSNSYCISNADIASLQTIFNGTLGGAGTATTEFKAATDMMVKALNDFVSGALVTADQAKVVLTPYSGAK